MSEPLSIIVPIYNAHAQLRECVQSLRRTVPAGVRVLLINDGSPSEHVSRYLLVLNADLPPNWEIIDRSDNWGFTRTVNQGLERVRGDVIILNSDTRVTAGWTQRMCRAAYHRPRVASVTPFSNAAMLCSLLAYCEEKPLPSGIDEERVQRVLWRLTPALYPELPTAVGFCMFMTAAALREVGYLDADGFPVGYGEENDWCERAKAKGFTHHLDDTTFIYHQGSASFQTRRALLTAPAERRIRHRWPGFFPDVERFLHEHALHPYIAVIGRALTEGA